MSKGEKRGVMSESFSIGVIAILFLIVGYQTSIFVHRASVTKIAADRDAPDTVFIYESAAAHDTSGGQPSVPLRKNSVHHPRAESVRKSYPRSKVESFAFNPNTVSIDELCRLGFSQKQAQSIDNYRKKGGRFRRKSDFAKSYVVSDSVYKRLEPYITIPLTDLNTADSAEFDALPGIGGWFASKMIEYRNQLGGYSYKEQLMEIWKFDQEKYDGLSDLVTVSRRNVKPFELWSLPAETLRCHPYIGDIQTAEAIVLFRNNNPDTLWTIAGLERAGVLSHDKASRLSRCVIAGSGEKK